MENEEKGTESGAEEAEFTEPETGEDRELKEAQLVVELYQSGLPIEKIAQRLNLGESTVRRRLKRWDQHIGREPADKEDLDEVTSLIFNFFKSDDDAEKLGQITGVNISIIKGILERIRRGEITKAELSRLLHNIKGGVVAYFGGSDVFKRFEELFLPKRHPFSESEIDSALKRKLGTNPKKKKKKKVEQAA